MCIRDRYYNQCVIKPPEKGMSFDWHQDSGYQVTRPLEYITCWTAIGETTLDRIHQSMILFAASRSEALKRFLVEDGAGRDHRFWRLAQALSALYPPRCEEKRWVDGVLARKKGLGL